jgi:hypothetical protein
MKQTLIDNNYLVIKNFIDVERAAALCKEFKDHCESNNLPGDNQVEESQAAYNYMSFLELLTEKTPEVSREIEEHVLPTYTYARIYKNGATLKKHMDRDACEISLTVHLDGDMGWPIFVQTPGGSTAEVVLEPGDALLYLGCEAPHWREEFDGNYYGQAFLHYVRSRGPRAYAFFDNDKGSITPRTQIDEEKKVDWKEVPKLETTEKRDKFRFNKNPQFTPSAREERVLKAKKEELMTSTLESYIKILEDEVPTSLCKRILDEYVNSDDWSPAQVVDPDSPIREDLRNCSIIYMSSDECIQKNQVVRSKLDEDLHAVLQKVAIKYAEMFPNINISMDTGYNLLRYETGQFYTTHCDDYKEDPRVLSCTVSLNDEYDGGEFSFFNDEMLVRTNTGGVICFPSNFMYPHGVREVVGGTRYAIVTWFR